MALTPGLTIRLADDSSERARRNHEQRIGELQALPAAAMKVIKGVVLKDGVTTPVSHKLGRPAEWFNSTHPRSADSGVTLTAGVVQETRDAAYDSSKFIVLTASGYGADITVDLVVM